MDNELTEGTYWVGAHFSEPAPGEGGETFSLGQIKRGNTRHIRTALENAKALP